MLTTAYYPWLVGAAPCNGRYKQVLYSRMLTGLAQIAKTKHFTDINRETLAALEAETATDFKRARLLQGAIVCSLTAIFLALLGSFLEGLTPFDINTKRFQRVCVCGS